MIEDFGVFTLEYLELFATKRKLEAFMHERYQAPLARVAKTWALANGKGMVKEPCSACRVQVSSTIEPGKGWYFEWTCGDGYGCSANTCGWYVPLVTLQREVELPTAP